MNKGLTSLKEVSHETIVNPRLFNIIFLTDQYHAQQ